MYACVGGRLGGLNINFSATGSIEGMDGSTGRSSCGRGDDSTISDVAVEVARAPSVNRRRSAHKTATHISVDLVIVLFRVDVRCHMSRVTVTRHNVCCI